MLERSPGEGNGYPLQYSGLENSIDGIVHGVAKSWTWLSDFHFFTKGVIYGCILNTRVLCELSAIRALGNWCKFEPNCSFWEYRNEGMGEAVFE